MSAFDAFTVQLPQPAIILAALIIWIVVYLVYRVAWQRDFGIPVRRRLFCAHLRVEGDQLAVAPLWWTDLQIQRALKAHWKQTLREGFPTPPGSPPATGLR